MLLKLGLVFVINIFFIFGCVQVKNKQRQFAGINVSQYTPAGVVQRTLSLKFNKIKRQDTVLLQAIVSSPFSDESPLNFKWKLGPDVIYVSGMKAGAIPHITKEKEVVFEIEVKNFDDETKRFIRFEILSENLNRRAFVDGLLSSTPKNNFESIVQQVEKIKKDESNND